MFLIISVSILRQGWSYQDYISKERAVSALTAFPFTKSRELSADQEDD